LPVYTIETFDLIKKFTRRKNPLTKIFFPKDDDDVIAVNKVNVNARKGELFGILGPNGAGKTTLIKLLCTLLLPTEGTAQICGHDIVKEEAQVKELIALVTGEERSFYWRLTGRQNLQFFAALYNLSKSEANARIEELLTILDLNKIADKRFESYSTGMKHKFSIARGLLTDPEVLFMDEPTRSLDPNSAYRIREFIKEKIVKEDKRTVFFATHNLIEATQLCDRIAIINKGEIKVCATLTDLQKMIQEPYKIILEIGNFSSKILEEISNLRNLIDYTHTKSDSNISKIEIKVSEIDNVFPELINSITKVNGIIKSCNTKCVTLDEIYQKITQDEGK
jgi:ABC-2 type transport system ATP-binding protein